MTSDAKQLRKEVEEFASLHHDKPKKFVVDHFAILGHPKSKIYYILRKKNEERNESKDTKKSDSKDTKKSDSEKTKKSDSEKTKKNNSKNMKKNDSKESKKNNKESNKMDKNESKKSTSKGSKKAEEPLDRRSKNFPPKMQANLKKYFARGYDVSIVGAAKKFDCSRSVIRYWIKRLNIDYEGYQSSMHWCSDKGNCSFCRKVAAAWSKK